MSECKVESCFRETPGHGAFLCLDHWRDTPKDLRDRIEAAYRDAKSIPHKWAGLDKKELRKKANTAKSAAKRAILVHWTGWSCPWCGASRIRDQEVACPACITKMDDARGRRALARLRNYLGLPVGRARSEAIRGTIADYRAGR